MLIFVLQYNHRVLEGAYANHTSPTHPRLAGGPREASGTSSFRGGLPASYFELVHSLIGVTGRRHTSAHLIPLFLTFFGPLGRYQPLKQSLSSSKLCSKGIRFTEYQPSITVNFLGTFVIYDYLQCSCAGNRLLKIDGSSKYSNYSKNSTDPALPSPAIFTHTRSQDILKCQFHTLQLNSVTGVVLSAVVLYNICCHP